MVDAIKSSRHRDEIRHLLTRYTYNGDRGRLDELAACFAPDGILEFPGQRVAGPDAIVLALSSGQRHPQPSFVRHHITPPLIEITGETATARSYFTVHTDIGPDHSGTYSDKLIHTETGWRFAHRLVRIDWQTEGSLFGRMVTRPASGV